METLAFFQAVLPDTGPYCLAVFKYGKKSPAHQQFDSLEALAKYAQAADQNKDLSVFHCCAAGTPVSGKRPNEDSPDWRAKSLWMDIDCGENKEYASQKEAAAALLKFCRHFQLPTPLVINSGYGVHCYWPFTRTVSLSEWVPMALALVRAADTYGLRIDKQVTKDTARILRPVGTHNKKNPDTPKRVKVAGPTQSLTPEAMHALLQEFVSASPAKTDVDSNLNDDLTAHAFVNLPSSMHVVADKCKQVAVMRDTQGDVGYEHWRGVIGLCKSSVEGIAIAREWSAKRGEKHEQTDVDLRYNTWKTAATRCAHFEQHNPSGCVDCPHKGQITSPIQLGRIEPEPAAEQMVDAVVDGEATKVQIPKLCAGYVWDDEKKLLARITNDKEGNKQATPFSRTLFYITHRVKYEDNSFGLGIRSHLIDGRIRDFAIDTGLLASPTKLAEELGHKGELLPTNSKDASTHMTAYLRDDLERIKKMAEELNTYTSFGWKHDMQAFLLGDRLYHQDGTTRTVLVGGYAANCLDHFPKPKGTVEGYASAVNHIYNVPGMEPMQYALCSGFGSLLTPFGENIYRGLMCALSSGTSGRGKTSVCMAALYAFGNPDKMTLRTNGTKNQRYAQVGTYSSVPVLFDEFTSMEPKHLSDLAYDIASGSDRKRLELRGGTVKMATPIEWWIAPYVTGNDDFHGKLAQFTPNSQAEAVRMVQIKIDEYDIPIYGAGTVDTALTHMSRNMGAAGEVFIKYVVQNRQEVADLFQKTMAEVSKHIDGPKYRFYRNHATCTLVAGTIMTKLGIVSFNYERLFAFAIRLMKKLCNEVAESNTIGPEDAIGMMVNEFMPRIMISQEYRDARDTRGREVGVDAPTNQPLAGRLIRGTGNSKDEFAGRLYLIKKDVKDWCMKRRLDYTSLVAHAQSKGFLIHESERFNLTRGTQYPTVQVTCLVLDHHAIEGVMPRLVLHTNQQHVDTPKEAAV